MAATAAMQKKVFTTVSEEVAHQRLIQNKWYPGGHPTAAIENEDEVRFIGADAYVPRLVAANVPIAKPAAPPPQAQAAGYSEPMQAKRPHFLRSQGGGAIPGQGSSLPSGGGDLPKGKAAVKEQPQEPSFPFNLLSGPGM
eukprot:TRINITY_DN11802_c0_g1_i1.p1 TRINITY_DN11802_c0_g1~~TRINITY_DN11802_c0_g1_i1.p1  ORF type:complete len:140 (-),score=46.94 TRINITY_DN11802_c0_g1_i1:49-468(-)